MITHKRYNDALFIATVPEVKLNRNSPRNTDCCSLFASRENGNNSQNLIVRSRRLRDGETCLWTTKIIRNRLFPILIVNLGENSRARSTPRNITAGQLVPSAFGSRASFPRVTRYAESSDCLSAIFEEHPRWLQSLRNRPARCSRA